MRYKVRDNDEIRLRGLMLDLPFDNSAELFYAVIYGWCQTTGVCWYWRDWLAEWLKTDILEVETIKDSLCQKGLISERKTKKEIELLTGKLLEDRNER